MRPEHPVGNIGGVCNHFVLGDVMGVYDKAGGDAVAVFISVYKYIYNYIYVSIYKFLNLLFFFWYNNCSMRYTGSCER